MKTLFAAAILAAVTASAASAGGESPPTYTSYDVQTPVYVASVTPAQLVWVPAVAVNNCCCPTAATTVGGYLVNIPGKNDRMVVYQ